jgi:hypothetical protein
MLRTHGEWPSTSPSSPGRPPPNTRIRKVQKGRTPAFRHALMKDAVPWGLLNREFKWVINRDHANDATGGIYDNDCCNRDNNRGDNNRI